MHDVLDEIYADMLHLNKEMQLGMDCSTYKDTFEERFQLQTLVLHQSMCILKAGFSSLRDCWVKYKEKVPMSDSNQIDETACNLKLWFTELKGFIHQKGVEKLVKGELCM